MAHHSIALRTALQLLIQFVVVARASSGSNNIFSRAVPSLFSNSNCGHRHRYHLPSALYDDVTSSSPQARTRTKSAAAVTNRILSIRGGGSIQTITSLSQIQTILDAASHNQLIVLDFTANNCPPCEMIAPIYTDLSQLDEFTHVIFCKVNVSDHPDVAERYGVDGWPTFLLFKGGEVVDSVVGGQAAKAGLYGLVSKHA